MKKLIILVLFIALAVVLFDRFVQPLNIPALIGFEQPYASYDDLVKRGVPHDRFAWATYGAANKQIEIFCYTHGRPEEEKYIDAYLEHIRNLTRNLLSYNVMVQIIDGCPYQINGKEYLGTGKVLKEDVFFISGT